MIIMFEQEDIELKLFIQSLEFMYPNQINPKMHSENQKTIKLKQL